MRSYRNRLILETGAANPQARSLKLDDELIGEATLADAILDRLVHNAYRVAMTGESMRAHRSRDPQAGTAEGTVQE